MVRAQPVGYAYLPEDGQHAHASHRANSQPRTVTLALGPPVRSKRPREQDIGRAASRLRHALMSMLVSLAHGDLLWLAIMDGVTAAGLAAYLALQDPQKKVRNVRFTF